MAVEDLQVGVASSEGLLLIVRWLSRLFDPGRAFHVLELLVLQVVDPGLRVGLDVGRLGDHLPVRVPKLLLVSFRVVGTQVGIGTRHTSLNSQYRDLFSFAGLKSSFPCGWGASLWTWLGSW